MDYFYRPFDAAPRCLERIVSQPEDHLGTVIEEKNRPGHLRLDAQAVEKPGGPEEIPIFRPVALGGVDVAEAFLLLGPLGGTDTDSSGWGFSTVCRLRQRDRFAWRP